MSGKHSALPRVSIFFLFFGCLYIQFSFSSCGEIGNRLSTYQSVNKMFSRPKRCFLFCGGLSGSFCYGRYSERYTDKAEPIFPAMLMMNEPSAVTIVGDSVTWHFPTSLDDLLRLKADNPSAKIVAGNTKVWSQPKLFFAAKTQMQQIPYTVP